MQDKQGCIFENVIPLVEAYFNSYFGGRHETSYMDDGIDGIRDGEVKFRILAIYRLLSQHERETHWPASQETANRNML